MRPNVTLTVDTGRTFAAVYSLESTQTQNGGEVTPMRL